MKKLNITKKKFTESKYFTTKYGKLAYVSESGNLYKTTKGKVLKFKESSDFSSKESEVTIHWLIDDEVLGITVDDEETIVVDLDLIDPEDPDTLVEAVQFELKKMYKGMSFEYDEDFIIKNEDEFWDLLGVKPNRTGITYESKESRVKKLNISKKQFGESKYFTTKYGKLEYVSESGNLYKTSKGHVIMFKEKSDIPQPIRDAAIKAQRILKDKAMLGDKELKEFAMRAKKLHRDELADAAEDILTYRDAAKNLTDDREEGGFVGSADEY